MGDDALLPARREWEEWESVRARQPVRRREFQPLTPFVPTCSRVGKAPLPRASNLHRSDSHASMRGLAAEPHLLFAAMQ